jgi:hypothetical protein
LTGTVGADAQGTNPSEYIGAPTLGAPSLVSGDNDFAVAFDGVTAEYIRVPDSASLNCFEGNNPWTIAVIVDHAPDVVWRRIASKHGGGSSGISIESQNANLLVSRGDGVGNEALYCQPLTPGRHLVVAGYDGAAMHMWVDGARRAPLYGATNPWPSARSLPNLVNPLYFGTDVSLASRWNGAMDEGMVYGRYLSDAEQVELWSAVSASIPLTGAGIAAILAAKGAQRSEVLTGAGTITPVGSKGGQSSVTATSGGAFVLGITGNHGASATLSAGGILAVVSSAGRAGTVTLTGGGSLVLTGGDLFIPTLTTMLEPPGLGATDDPGFALEQGGEGGQAQRLLEPV